jgi:uncharacterized protein (TIGR03435 family)
MVPVMAAAQQFMPDFGPPVDRDTRFEVVVIKPFADADGQVLMRMAPGRFESSLPVGVLLRQALQKPDYQILGAPGWMETERYSIIAKPPEGVPPTAISVLLTKLLKDRFQLATHLETREQPIFHLVMTRADGRLGPDIKPTSAECQTTIAERNAAAKAPAGRGGPPPASPPLPGPDEPVPCGFFRIPVGRVAASGFTIAQLAPTLSDLTGRPVIDKTGLTGLYDFTLRYAPEFGRVAGPLGSLSPGTPAPAIDPDTPTLFTAVQEQLGLKLESARGPVEVVVIDRLEKPVLD